jgi:hypothetical protein
LLKRPARDAPAGVPLFVQRTACEACQREEAQLLVQRQEESALPPVPSLRLTPPSLLEPRAPYSNLRLAPDLELRLSPETQALMLESLRVWLGPSALADAIGRIDFSVLDQPAPAFDPFAAPSVPAPAPLVPRGAGPAVPRAAGAGELARAALAVPAVRSGLDRLCERATGILRRDWDRLGTGERIGVVSWMTVIGGGALAGVIADPGARSFALSQLNGRVLPVPGLDWMRVELHTGESSLMVGTHIDVGGLLQRYVPQLGFGPSSPSAIGGPPAPAEPGPPIQRMAQTDAIAARADTGERIRAQAGRGAALPPRLRNRLEDALDTDLAGVRVHHDAEADALAHDLRAHAFTTGEDIFFRAGLYAPASTGGAQLIAHEVVHTVQQRDSAPAAGGADGLAISTLGEPAEVEADRIARGFVGAGADARHDDLHTPASRRQDGAQVRPRSRRRGARPPPVSAREPRRIARNPVLTPEDMFGIIERERAWTFNPGGMVCEDPTGTGRGVGPAAGGRRAGHAVFAVIQVTDADGRPVALSYGEHVSYGDPHAEQRAVAALRREIPALRDVSGGRMTVVLDQVPCPAGRRDCMGLLQRFARERGLQLDIRLPTREAVSGGGTVAPRTAAMSSQRTDVPRVSLRSYYPPGTEPAPGAPAPPAAPAPSSGPAPPPRPPRLVPPPPATPAMVRQRASLIASLEAETARSARITARVALAARGVTGLLGILGMMATLRDMQQIATHGTLFADAERQADRVGDYGAELEEWAIETTNEISLLGAVSTVHDAIEREDSDALFDLDSALTDLYMPFLEQADRFQEFAGDLRAREQALDVMKDFYRTLVSVPQGPSTAPNAQAFAMYVSLERLANRVGNAAGHFEAAEAQLRWYGDALQSLAHEANSAGWTITFGSIAFAMAEMDRERELGERLTRERRLNEIHRELEAIELEVGAPVCRPQDEADYYVQRREALLLEREALRSSTPATTP